MKDIQGWLQTADPLAGELPLGEDEVQRMRTTVLAAIDQRPLVSTPRWGRVIAAALAVALAVTVVAQRSLRLTRDAGNEALNVMLAEPPVNTPRQLEFVTAGGTRVIWNFNPDFEIKGSGR